MGVGRAEVREEGGEGERVAPCVHFEGVHFERVPTKATLSTFLLSSAGGGRRGRWGSKEVLHEVEASQLL